MTVVRGRLKCITEKYIPHYTRPIGSAPTSGARPNWWCYPRRKRRGEVSGDVHTSAHAQFGSWACMSQNGVMTRGDAHKSMHAKCWSWNDAGVWRHEQLERWGRCKLRHPPNAKLNPERHSQGGVVDSHGHIGGWSPGCPLSCSVPKDLAGHTRTASVSR